MEASLKRKKKVNRWLGDFWKRFSVTNYFFFPSFFLPVILWLPPTYLRTYYLANLSLIAGLPFSQPVSFFWAKHKAPRASKQSTRQTWINSFVAARHFTSFEDIVTQHTSHISRCSARGVCSNARTLAPQSIIYHSIHKENLRQSPIYLPSLMDWMEMNNNIMGIYRKP